MKLVQSFREFTPTKSMLAWTAAGASALTMAVGFTAGGWMTGGSASEMSAAAASAAHVELASDICVDNFASSAAAAQQHAELVALSSSFRQRGYVEDQPWALLPGETSADRKVADLCARKIAAMDPETFPPIEEAAAPLATEVDPG